MRSYCRVGSISKDIEGSYDLITCIEVLEHLRESGAQEAIRRMCAGTNTIFLSSTPYEDEAKHLKVRPLLYWMTSFQQHGFAPDLGFDATFVAHHAVLLRRAASPWSLEVLQTFIALM